MNGAELDQLLDEMHQEAMKTGQFVERHVFGRTVSAIRRMTGKGRFNVNFHIDRLNVRRADMVDILTNPIGFSGVLFSAQLSAFHARQAAKHA